MHLKSVGAFNDLEDNQSVLLVTLECACARIKVHLEALDLLHY